MHHDDGGRRDRQFRFKARYLILAAFMLLLVAAILHMALLSSGANQRLEALRAAGQPTSLAELAARNKLPMGMENAAPIYESAFTAFVPPPDPNVPYVGKTAKFSERGAAWPEPVARAVADCLAANEACLALLHQAAGIQTCRYDYDYAAGYQRYQELRPCMRLLELAAVHKAREGDATGAMVRIKDGLCLGDSLRQEPFLIPHLVRNSCIAVAIQGLEQALSLTTFTDAQLRDLDDALAVTAGRLDLAWVLSTERCLMIEYVRNPALMGQTGMGPAPGLGILKFPGIRSRGLVDILDYMGACVEAAELPLTERPARFRAIGAELDKLSFFHLTVKLLAPALTRVAELDSRVHAHLDLGRTALAIERYRLAKGEPPKQLADLVPAYLEQVPIDPFDGAPLRYRRTEPGYVLYSVMEDRQDNGGKEREDVGRGDPYDLCFIVTR